MISAPRGTRDILPGEVEKWRYVEELAHRLCAEYGYSEIRTPLFEHTELFERLGEATDTVRKEMYTFPDRGGRSLTLRPEGTAPVVRAFLEGGLKDGPLPQKLYYLGPMFRYERPQSGRYRQHHQFGVEALGSLNPALDAEVILLAVDFCSRLGLEVRVEINSIGCPTCRPAYREALKGFLADRVGGLCDDCRERYQRNVLRVLDCKVAACQALVAGAPQALDMLCPDCSSHFQELEGLLADSGVPHCRNPRLVRGFDYYTKTVFEVAASGRGLEKALCGGGRYDGLASELG
ncbi:MAG: histidine--tRNA ligase, partial [Acetobacteraceae bacterium]|nr:histidine--tRNA ligase [Acetobacteraceae bacterium]